MALRCSQKYATTSSAPTLKLQCVLPTLNTALVETELNLNTINYSANNTESFFPIGSKFRAYDDGRETTFSEIATSGGLTIPTTNGASITWSGQGAPVGGLQIKRAGCLCSPLTEFKIRYQTAGISTVRLTFNDGFIIDLGESMQVLTVKPDTTNTYSIVSSKKVIELIPGDFVIKSGNIAPTMAKAENCLVLTSSGSVSHANTAYVHSIETTWPQDEFSSSTVRAMMMLENGMYILSTPVGGDY